jgi:transketolase
MQIPIDFLAHKAYLMRKWSIIMTTAAGSGHPTSALSASDIVAVLFFQVMRFDPIDPTNPNNDRFILSKGHASPILYAAWKELGILTEQDLMAYRTFNSVLEGHPTPRFSRSEAATGSLGQGLSIGVGMALEARMDHRSFHTYVLLGDAETAEGSVWEAAELAGHYQVNNLTAIIDVNRLGQSGPTMDQYHLERYAEKFRAFGWQPFIVDGHNIQSLIAIFAEAKNSSKPVVIVAKTHKGYGVADVQDKEGFHGKPFAKKDLDHVLQELAQQAGSAVKEVSYQWQPQLPKKSGASSPKTKPVSLPLPAFVPDKKVATRHAYGTALLAVGVAAPNVVVLDADVKNSTGTENFAKQFPDRFVESFIAEQNMIGMAVGLALRGKISFVATFGAFFTRAYDQIRMAAIGRVPLRLAGSHAGVSIGQDGPSQMALEDIAIMRALPNSIVLYPCDAISTYKLVELMANYDDGISYLRTTRGETPIVYEPDDEFKLGDFSILRSSNNDQLCIITAGITIFEALKAYETLKKENISVAIIDLYSIKPINEEHLAEFVAAHGNYVITVEDHYLQGGLGQAVLYALRNTGVTIQCLAVTKLPRSGMPEALLAYEDIDADAIIKIAQKMI